MFEIRYMWQDVSFTSSFLLVFMPVSDGKGGIFNIMQHNTNYAEGSDPLSQKRFICLVDASYVSRVELGCWGREER